MVPALGNLCSAVSDAGVLTAGALPKLPGLLARSMQVQEDLVQAAAVDYAQAAAAPADAYLAARRLQVRGARCLRGSSSAPLAPCR